MKCDSALRETIENALRQLQFTLGFFDQTTHGSIFLNGVGIDAVADALTRCYQEPTAYTISQLSQVIDAFCREKK